MFLLVPLIMQKTERVEIFILARNSKGIRVKEAFFLSSRGKKIPNMYNLLSRYSEKECTV